VGARTTRASLSLGKRATHRCHNMEVPVEMPHRNSLCSYLKQVKNVIFFLNSYTKLENRKAEQVLPRGAWLVPVGRGESW
jgi:hypothetical protein